MGTFLNQLAILIYKNLLLKIRRPFNTIMELSFPLQLVLLIWLMTAFGFNVPQHQESFPTLSPTVPSWWLSSSLSKNGGASRAKVAISVLNSASNSLKASVPFIKWYIERNAPVQVVTLSENSPEQYWKNYKQYVSHIVVQGLDTGYSQLVDTIVIQNHTDIVGNQTIDFVNSGYMVLENVLQEALIKYKYDNDTSMMMMTTTTKKIDDGDEKFKINFKTREFPIKGDNSLLAMIAGIMYPMYFSMSVINLFLPHMVHLVTEKKEKIKSGLQMMGCSMIAYNLSWFFVAFIESVIVVLSTSILVYAIGIFKHTSITMFVTVFFLYTQSFIPIANAGSLFFVEPKYASMVANLGFLAVTFMWLIIRLVFNFVTPSLWYV